jgi:hypothetical protein
MNREIEKLQLTIRNSMPVCEEFGALQETLEALRLENEKLLEDRQVLELTF